MRLKAGKAALIFVVLLMLFTVAGMVAVADEAVDMVSKMGEQGDVMKLLSAALVAEAGVIGWLVRMVVSQNKDGAVALANVSAKLSELIDELRARPCIGDKGVANGAKKYSIR